MQNVQVSKKETYALKYNNGCCEEYKVFINLASENASLFLEISKDPFFISRGEEFLKDTDED